MHAVEMRGISKRFGNTQALDQVDFVASPGEIHGLIGHNGSGKSTLIKILAGRVQADRGSVRPPSSGRAATQVSFVHQNLAVLPELTVTENLMLPDLGASHGVRPIAWRSERRRAEQLLRRNGLDIDPQAKLADLAPVDHALVAITRALSPSLGDPDLRPQVLVLDEPTVFLPRTEVGRIFGVVRNMVAKGTCVIFVSHRLDEVLDFTDRVTVLRDGRVIATTNTADLTRQELVDLIVGDRAPAAPQAESLRTRSDSAQPGRDYGIHVRRLGWRSPVDITVRSGEIVGVTGLIGSGYERVVTAPYGDRRATATPVSGSMTVDGASYDLLRQTPRRARGQGLEYIPADRTTGAVVGELSLGENLILGDLGPYFRRGLLHFGRMRQQVLDLLHGFGVTPQDPELAAGGLSGGNQQKVVVARTMHRGPRLLLLHEPTQGVDVGSRRQITDHVRAAAQAGAAVVCASSDEDQLVELCDRVHVIGETGLVATLAGADLTPSSLVRAVVGSGGERG